MNQHNDIEPEFYNIAKRCDHATMTSTERLYALYKAVEYIVQAQIPGDIVECGVWRGGSMMCAALCLLQLGDTSRQLYLYDTYEGMPAPEAVDIDIGGIPAENQLDAVRAYSPLETVMANMESTGYPVDKIHYIRGKVEDTVPAATPDQIAILRLDTDWYSSTRHELIYLFPLVSAHGVLIVDDYGHWKGARLAVDEYFRQSRFKVLLSRIDYTCRMGVKSPSRATTEHVMQDHLIDVREIVSLNERLFSKVRSQARHALRRVSTWIPETGSVAHAGYGGACNPDLGIDHITDETTYSDLLAFFANYLDAPISYLEIGVSVGKNFYQLYSVVGGAASYFCALDAEEPNPRLEAALPEMLQEIELGSAFSFMHLHKTQRSRKYAKVPVKLVAEYLVADLWQDIAWRYLAGRRFNIILSDAFHDPAAISHEFDMMEKFSLVDKREFVGIWDDMGDPAMQKIFFDRMERWIGQGTLRPGNFCLLWCRGTYGPPRVVGVATNLRRFDLGMVREVAARNK